MITTTLMTFELSYSKKYNRWLSIASANGVVYAIPKDENQYTGLLEVTRVNYLTDKYALVKANPVNADLLTEEDIDYVADKVLCSVEELGVCEGKLLSAPCDRIVFKRGGHFYIADGRLPKQNCVKVSELRGVHPIPYEVALCVAATKSMEGPVMFDGKVVYDDEAAYGVSNDKIVPLPLTLTTPEAAKKIPETEITEFLIRNHISNHYSENKTIEYHYHVFGRDITVKAFSKNGMSLHDYIHGSKVEREVADSFKELEDFKVYALRQLGTHAISDVAKLSRKHILGYV